LIEGEFSKDIVMTVESEIKYTGYLNRQQSEVKRISRAENVKIPVGFEYGGIKSISHESRDKLERIRPRTLGQASRISGVKPSDIAVLDILLARKNAE
ncbi:tRNA uridine-5-carboxymethylaminomethyl(34) synthesis enzyme MnmG, partial [bacterium]|nr:tRNA uridine-5-carboxymethylaminomethyl(34) synthesis enzyme MnmG [bacterium]